MLSWGEGFADGDSGVPVPGTAARLWQEIDDAKKELARKPLQYVEKPLGYVQAEILRIAEDSANDVNARLAAYSLAWDMAKYIAEAGIDPLANRG